MLKSLCLWDQVCQVVLIKMLFLWLLLGESFVKQQKIFLRRKKGEAEERDKIEK